MPRYICQVVDQTTNKEYFLEWSSVVDAPVTFGMPHDQFMAYYKEEYGEKGMRELPDRMERVKQFGTSSRFQESFDEMIILNHAGKNGTLFSKEQIIKWYCRRKENPEEEGVSWSKIHEEPNMDAFLTNFHKSN